MAEILITGGAGNLGRTLAQRLREEGHRLRILDLPSCDYSPFQGWDRMQIIHGDILDLQGLKESLEGVDWIYHLAAILPPGSEIDRERTFRVNVEGTRCLLDACGGLGEPPKVIFASSVSVYGDTSWEAGIIRPDHPVQPNDWYAESKVEAERILIDSGIPHVNLRVSGIVIPAFLDPPEPWPFTGDQRIELVALEDVIRAMVVILGVEEILGHTLLIAGGRSWQVTGEQYVRRWGEIMEIPLDEMSFQNQPGWLNWYDTTESQTLLNYQRITLNEFFKQLEAAVAEALA